MMKNMSGFVCLSSRPVAELEATLHLMEHEKSGARLVWLERAEENKTFGIAFQTQPWDDSGIFHILEHSVLCGSRRYPVKEPFVELLKSSLNTFLNAMTFPDKTFYPVSSRNEQDFFNLLRVYMDAVFFPAIHERSEIFGQEGWHYELDEEGRLSYKGVVFNEMKGAFASADTLLDNEMSRRLFPDTCYRFVSGGDPEHIPELSYEQFAAAHRRLYHPSNSYIVLDGSVDIARTLSVLDEEFLSAFSRSPAPAPIPLQAPVDGGAAELYYELSDQEELDGRARLAQGFVACTWQDRQEQTALQILGDALCGDNEAPLVRLLLEKDLARDVQLGLRDGMLQPWLCLEARDIRPEQADEVADTLRQELERLCREGLDHERLLASLDNMEFQARQRDYGQTPQGLVFAMQMLDSWLYGGDPAANLSVGTLFDDLREKCAQGYFEQLLRRVLLENPHRCRVLLLPSHTVGQERRQREQQRLEDIRRRLSPEELETIRLRQETIQRWQDTPDTPEQLASIPTLRLDQIPDRPERLPLEQITLSGLPVLLQQQPTGGVTYLNLYFDLNDMSPEELSQVSFLSQLLGSLDTLNHAQEQLQRDMRSLFGGLGFGVEIYGRNAHPEECRSFLCASCSVLDGKLSRALPLLTELLTRSRWDMAERIRNTLRQDRAEQLEDTVMSGHSAAMGRVSACLTAEGAAAEYAGGIAYLQWLTELEQHFDERFPALSRQLEELARRVFCRARLTLGVTAGTVDTARQAADYLAGQLEQGSYCAPAEPMIRPWGRRREGIVIPADVSFAALGGRLPQAVHGSSRAAAKLISLTWLWNAVRVQGGAYGVGMGMRGSGVAGFYSYRDPSAARTLDCYRASGDCLRQAEQSDLSGMIVGAVADSDPLLTPRARGKLAQGCYWRQVSYEDLCRTRQELLSATAEDMLALAQPLDEMMEDASLCVLGSREQLDACGDQLEQRFAL